MSRNRSGSAQLSEAIRSEMGVGVPQIIAGEIDVLPPDGGKVSKQRVRDDSPAAAEVVESTAEIHGVPEDDSGGDGREPARTILLCFGRTIAQPTEAMKADSAGEGVARLALVELDGHLPGVRVRTRVFSELQSHYVFGDRFGRPGKGNDKGKVEGLIGWIRRNLLHLDAGAVGKELKEEQQRLALNISQDALPALVLDAGAVAKQLKEEQKRTGK